MEKSEVKQGAAIGGWICFALGIVFMWWSVWSFIIYGPLFFVSFILSIVALAQRRIGSGIVLLLSTLIAPGIIWLFLANKRMGEFNQKLMGRPSPFEAPLSQNNTTSPPITPQTPREVQTRVTPTITSIAPNRSAPPSPTPDASAQERETIAKFFAVPLADLHASDITVHYRKLLGQHVPLQPTPIFSADGELVMFPQQEGNSIALVVAHLRDHSIVETWSPAAVPTALGWSDDLSLLAYKSGQILHVVKWRSKEDVTIPLSEFFGRDDSHLAWVGTSKLFCIDDYDRTILTLDLDSLKIQKTEFSRDEFTLKRQRDDVLGGPRLHPYCKVFQEQIDTEGSQNGPFLFIGENDKSYSHVLLQKFFAQTPFYVSPDLRHILVVENNSLNHFYLAHRDSPPLFFRMDLNNQELLTPERRTQFEKYVKKGVPFWGTVYAPLTNPLNGKMVGADLKRLKGFVRIFKWNDTNVVVKVARELIPMQAGDIVTHITSEQWGEFGNWPFEYKDEWRPLMTVGSETVPQPSPEPLATSATAVSSIAQPAASSGGSAASAPDNSRPAQLQSPGSPTAPYVPTLPGERFSETRTRFLTGGDIQNWDDEKLRYAINEMYARRGADFRDKAVKKWFRRFSWYHPIPGATYDDTERTFTDIEKRNEDLLGAYRNAKKGLPASAQSSPLQPAPKTLPAGGSLHERTRGLDNL